MSRVHPLSAKSRPTQVLPPTDPRRSMHASSKPIRPRTKRPTLTSLGISPEEALEIRMSLGSFEEDWNAPGMEVYDKLNARGRCAGRFPEF